VVGEKLKYEPIFFAKTHVVISLQDHAESFYRASLRLIQGVAKRELYENFEGLAALFLTRHYLELALKGLLEAGRDLTVGGRFNSDTEIPTERIHPLQKLWKLVLKDAKPKFGRGQWKSYDVEYVEQCLAEFDRVDPRGFAFRYYGEGSEKMQADFVRLEKCLRHVRSVLESMRVSLCIAWNANEEASEPQPPEELESEDEEESEEEDTE
jgi:hypothetical protein